MIAIPSPTTFVGGYWEPRCLRILSCVLSLRRRHLVVRLRFVDQTPNRTQSAIILRPDLPVSRSQSTHFHPSRCTFLFMGNSYTIFKINEYSLRIRPSI